MNHPALFFLALGLAACTPAPRPHPPEPVLILKRLDARHVQATLQPAPVSGYWRLRLSAECGASDGPPTGGQWPTDSGSVVVMAGRGDLFSATIVTAHRQEVTVADCIPEVAWNHKNSN